MFYLQVFVTRGGADAEKSAAIPLKSGRPDVAAILAAVASAKGAEGPVGLFACGPEPMLDASRSAVAAQNASATSPSQRAVIHTEVFNY
jgi:NAD(P)H-flavin reductase